MAAAYLQELEGLLSVMEKVYAMTERHGIRGRNSEHSV
jgi:hypothetical protein